MTIRGKVAGALFALLVGCGARGKIGLPTGFPPDVPLPEGAVVRVARDLGMRGLTVVLETGEDVRTSAETMGGRMRAAGWSVVAEAVVDDAVFTSYRKAERSVAVGVSRAGRSTVLSLSIVERPFNEWEGDQG